MSAPVRFLNGFAQALATMGLYAPGHPARARVVELSYGTLRELQEQAPRAVFSFLDDSVVFGQLPLPEMRQWPWGRRLAEVGVQRLELDPGASREDFESFLNAMLGLLKLPGMDMGRGTRQPAGIRYGAVSVRGEEEEEEEQPVATASVPVSLHEEAAVMRWLAQDVNATDRVPLEAAQAVVRSLTVAMHGDSSLLVPLLKLKNFDEYAAMHAINVSVLTMTLAESLGLGPRDIHAFGIAGLLHDVGMSRVPRELVTKDSLSPDEQAVIERHPVDGARLLLKSDAKVDIAAAAAFEHHLRPDGLGYPAVRFPRDVHYASRMVRVCSVYDALRTARPFRPAWNAAQALGYIEGGAGTEFDPAVAKAFTAMMRQIEARVVHVEEPAAM